MATQGNAKNTPCRSGGISKSLLTPCRRVGLSRKISTPTALINATPTTVTPETAKNTPRKTEGINKSLLTPCRRIGLSRKIATPNRCPSLINTTPAAVKETSLVVLKEAPPEAVKETPVIRETVSVEKRNVKATPKQQVVNTTKPKEKVPLSKENIAHNNIQTLVLTKTCDTTNSTLKNAIKNKLKSPKPADNICVSLENSNFGEINNKTKMHKPKTKLFKRLSMKKESSVSQDDLSDLEELPSTPPTSMSSLLSEEFKECLVASQNDGDSSEPVSVAPRKLNKKRRVLYSSDEEDFIPSQKQMKMEQDSNGSPEDLDTKITEVKKRIETKAAHLAELKQAAVYRRLHDIDELKGLTEIWKQGCQDGLRHLLRKLREHIDMNMCTLMMNLKIPPSIISYDMDNDSFV